MKPTKQAVYSSRTADKFVVRLPDDMREKIAELARKHHRSMNSQIINWLEICVELEMADIPVTRETLANVAEIIGAEIEKPVTAISFGETVRVAEGFLNDLTKHKEFFGNEPRQFETDDEVVQVFALGRVSVVNIAGGKALLKVRWLHNDVESDWIPFSHVQRID
jgi:predicted transcriptional regulator